MGVPPFGGRTLFDVIAQKRGFSLPHRRDFGIRVSRRVYGIVKVCLEWSPDKRKIDLDELAAWSAPVAIPGELWSQA